LHGRWPRGHEPLALARVYRLREHERASVPPRDALLQYLCLIRDSVVTATRHEPAAGAGHARGWAARLFSRRSASRAKKISNCLALAHQPAVARKHVVAWHVGQVTNGPTESMKNAPSASSSDSDGSSTSGSAPALGPVGHQHSSLKSETRLKGGRVVAKVHTLPSFGSLDPRAPTHCGAARDGELRPRDRDRPGDVPAAVLRTGRTRSAARLICCPSPDSDHFRAGPISLRNDRLATLLLTRPERSDSSTA
jgi:hypothetical protein